MLARRDFDALFQGLIGRFPSKQGESVTGRHAPMHLFYDSGSICSRRMRSVLLAAGKPFASHVIDVFERGLDKEDDFTANAINRMISGFTIDSHDAEPSLINAAGRCALTMVVFPASQEVLIDPVRICAKVDEDNPSESSKLMPFQLAELIKAEIDIIDGLHSIDPAPSTSKKARTSGTRPQSNADSSKNRRTHFARQVRLRAAANRLPEHPMIDGERFLVEIELSHLEKRLKKSAGPYRFGSLLTVADLFWAFELMRIENPGAVAALSDGSLPAVAKYYSGLVQLPAIRGAMLETPGNK